MTHLGYALCRCQTDEANEYFGGTTIHTSFGSLMVVILLDSSYHIGLDCVGQRIIEKASHKEQALCQSLFMVCWLISPWPKQVTCPSPTSRSRETLPLDGMSTKEFVVFKNNDCSLAVGSRKVARCPLAWDAVNLSLHGTARYACG